MRSQRWELKVAKDQRVLSVQPITNMSEFSVNEWILATEKESIFTQLPDPKKETSEGPGRQSI